jgi:COMPASS component SWD2
MMRMGLASVSKNDAPVNSLDFDDEGKQMITASADGSLHLYSCDNASLRKTLFDKVNGCSSVAFTHSRNCVLTASTRDHRVRYHSLHDNSYLRYFDAHTDRVDSVVMSPVDDTFMTCSADRSVRMWDLRTNECKGVVSVKGTPVCAYDPEGVVFGVATFHNDINLYDSRSYANGPFATFRDDKLHIQRAVSGKAVEWCDMQFSPDGKNVLMSADNNHIQLLDSFSGDPVQSFDSRVNRRRMRYTARFSPDGTHVVSGGDDSVVRVWNVQTGAETAQWRGCVAPPTIVKFHPTRNLAVTGCNNIGWWLPQN